MCVSIADDTLTFAESRVYRICDSQRPQIAHMAHYTAPLSRAQEGTHNGGVRAHKASHLGDESRRKPMTPLCEYS